MLEFLRYSVIPLAFIGGIVVVGMILSFLGWVLDCFLTAVAQKYGRIIYDKKRQGKDTF